MKNVNWICALCLVVVTVLCGTIPTSAQARFTRTIVGVVVDKEEQPVAGARVCANGTGGMGGRVPCDQSNAKGRFAIEVYRPDTYTITAENVARGYPEPLCRFYGELFCNFPVVTIDHTSAATPVKVKLGPKAGRVIFTILDDKTNTPITQGMIIVSRIGDPLSYWSKSTGFPRGQYDLLTPDAPFTVKFETWNRVWVKRAAFDTSGAEIKVIQVALGERKEITVRLK